MPISLVSMLEWRYNLLQGHAAHTSWLVQIVYLLQHLETATSLAGSESRTHMAQLWVVLLDEGSWEMHRLLGGKGASLAEMTRLGIPTVPGFVITTEAWCKYSPGSRSLSSALWNQVTDAVAALEAKTGKEFGLRSRPLIVSVRSSPVATMPGQLRTILNVGLTREIVNGLAEQSPRPESWYDAYMRLIRMYGVTVHNIPKGMFGEVLQRRRPGGAAEEGKSCLDAEVIKPVIEKFLAVFWDETGEEFPQDPYVQLERSIAAVFDSWFAENAVQYRAFEGIPDDLGTAVVVQMMVFGNLGPDSASGVVFSRSPATGEQELYGEYLPESQGEDVVGGLVTPRSIAELSQEQPRLYEELKDICARLEAARRDVQDVEFTVEEGRLWILQARRAKRTPLATVKVAVDMAQEGLISQEEAVRRVDPESLGQMFASSLTDASATDMLARGIESSPGAVSGRVALDVDQAQRMARDGTPVILVTEETSPDDAAVMPLVSGILTRHGGATSHAAVVARGLGKPCVVGCEAMQIDVEHGRVHFGEVTIASGDEISIDGSTGRVFAGRRELAAPCLSEAGELNTLLAWADGLRRLRVLADVSTPAEIEVARELGAEGIGLLRTERLYYGADFLPLFREWLLAGSSSGRGKALNELRSLHRQEFRAVLEAAAGLPVTVRLLNAPLEYFLPARDGLLTELAELRVGEELRGEIGPLEEVLRAVDDWTQANPEYGLRGARLVVAAPDVVRAQLEGLFEGASDAARAGLVVDLGILVPFVNYPGEVDHYRQLIAQVAQTAGEREGARVAPRVGAGIESARSALVAGQLASKVDFLCFDGDGLTASVLSCSQEARSRFLPAYLTEGIIASDPFSTVDEEGVGALMRLAVERARSARANIEIRVYGIDSTDPVSIRLFHEWGLDALACDPSHLLAARLSAAQAAIG